MPTTEPTPTDKLADLQQSVDSGELEAKSIDKEIFTIANDIYKRVQEQVPDELELGRITIYGGYPEQGDYVKISSSEKYPGWYRIMTQKNYRIPPNRPPMYNEHGIDVLNHKEEEGDRDLLEMLKHIKSDWDSEGLLVYANITVSLIPNNKVK